MANVVKLKRGTGSDPTASDMVVGEPVIRTDTAELFFKKDDGSVAKVSGGGGGPDFKYLELRNAANNGAASYPGNDFTLVTAGTTNAKTPTAANTLLVSYGGVIQKPNSGTSTSGITGFIVDGSRLKTATNFAAAPDFILYQESGGIGEPSDDTVTTDKIVDDAVTADKLANSINSEIAANTAKVTNATHTGEVTGATALTIADNIVDEANLKVSNSPTNGYFLSAQSGNTGGLTWAQVTTDLVGDTSPQLGGDLDVNGNEIISSATDGDIELNPNGTGDINLKTAVGGTTNLTSGGDVVFSSGVTNALCQWDYSQYQLEFWDNVKASFGSDEDLFINHNGTDSNIINGTGDLYIQNTGDDINIRANDDINLQVQNGEAGINIIGDGAVELFHDGTLQLFTRSTGAEVTTTGAVANFVVRGKEGYGASLTLASDDGDDPGDYARILQHTDEHLYFQVYNQANNAYEDAIVAKHDGAVELFHDNSKKLNTESWGVQITGSLQCSSHINLGDDDKIKLGDGEDFQIYHSNSLGNVIGATGGHTTKFFGPQVEMYSLDGTKTSAKFDSDDAVSLYYNNSKKAETNSSGLLVNNRLQLSGPSVYDKAGTGNSIGIQLSSSGVLPTDGSGTAVNNSKNLGSSSYKWAQVYATTFYGDGSNLTNLPASGIPASGGTFTGDIAVSGGAGALTVNGNSDIRFSSGNWTGESCKIQHHSSYLYMQGGSNGFVFRSSGGTDRWYIDANGNFYPNGNGNYNVGSSSYRVANLYVNDMHFSNKGKKNVVDGTWGDWTLQEGDENIFMINNRSGKRYKMALQEVT